MTKSTQLGPIEAGILAGMGFTTAPVYRLPRVAIFTTGDEIVFPGKPLPPGKIYNSNQTFLVLRLLDLGVQVIHIESIPDDPRIMAKALKKVSQNADLIFSTGAVSMGKKDIMDETLAQIGAEKIFWHILARPGMPTRFSVYDGVPILSLSGNPSGVAVMTEILARPMIQKMKQDNSLTPVRVKGHLADTSGRSGKMRRFVYAAWKQGVFHLPDRQHTNGSLASMAGCNCLIDIRTDHQAPETEKLLEAILL